MKYNSSIRISSQDADTLFSLLQKETKETQRVEINLTKDKNEVIMNIIANDATSFRSHMNALGQLFTLYEQARTLE